MGVNVFKVVLVLIFLLFPFFAWGAEDPMFELSGSLPEIQPEIERRDIKIPRIDSEYFELGLLAGSLSVEDFGSHFLYGIQGSLHITQSFFFKAQAVRSKINDNVFRRLGLPLFVGEGTQAIEKYSVLLGWDVFPGEVYLGESYTISSSIYMQAGASSIHIGEKDYLGVVVGVGLRLMPLDWFAFSLDVSGSEYNSDLFGFEKISHDYETSIGLSVYF